MGHDTKSGDFDHAPEFPASFNRRIRVRFGCLTKLGKMSLINPFPGLKPGVFPGLILSGAYNPDLKTGISRCERMTQRLAMNKSVPRAEDRAISRANTERRLLPRFENLGFAPQPYMALISMEFQEFRSAAKRRS